MKPVRAWAYFVESAPLKLVLDDAAVAADTADRLRNLGLVVLEHRREIEA